MLGSPGPQGPYNATGSRDIHKGYAKYIGNLDNRPLHAFSSGDKKIVFGGLIENCFYGKKGDDMGQIFHGDKGTVLERWSRS